MSRPPCSSIPAAWLVAGSHGQGWGPRADPYELKERSATRNSTGRVRYDVSLDVLQKGYRSVADELAEFGSLTTIASAEIMRRIAEEAQARAE